MRDFWMNPLIKSFVYSYNISKHISCRLGVDFVSRHGIFGKLLRASYNLEQIDLYVTLYRGTFYLLEAFGLGEEEPPLTPNKKPGEDKAGIFEGSKFRQLVTSGKFKSRPVPFYILKNIS